MPLSAIQSESIWHCRAASDRQRHNEAMHMSRAGGRFQVDRHSSRPGECDRSADMCMPNPQEAANAKIHGGDISFDIALTIGIGLSGEGIKVKPL